MTNIIISTASWHYRLLNKHNRRAISGTTNICSYTKSVIVTALMVGVLYLMAGMWAAFIVGDTIAWVAACITTWTFIDIGFGVQVLLALIGVLVAITACFYASCVYNDWSDRRHNNGPSATTQAYRAWKSKFCQRVRFSDDQ